MMLIRCSNAPGFGLQFSSKVQWHVVAADVIVIPLSCSCSIQSMVAVLHEYHQSYSLHQYNKGYALSCSLTGIDMSHNTYISGSL